MDGADARRADGRTGVRRAAADPPGVPRHDARHARHLTKVERTWLRVRVPGEDVEPLFPRTEEDFDDVAEALAPQALDDLRAEWAACDAAVADLPLDSRFVRRGEELSLGLVYVHLVHEYARHNGHADLLRQAIDGVTGR